MSERKTAVLPKKSITCSILCVIVLFFIPFSPVFGQSVVINEVVTDPQQNWDDSGCSGDCGSPFDNNPGPLTTGEPPSSEITNNDEWIELYNASASAIDLTAGTGWTLTIQDSSTYVENFKSPSSSTDFYFSNGGTFDNFKAGEYLIIGGPPNTSGMNNDVYLVLRNGDPTPAIIDEIEFGDQNYDGDTGDAAAPDGNADTIFDESVVRFPNGMDTNDDADDTIKRSATIAASNGTGTGVVGNVLINEVVTDPYFDWDDTVGGNGIAFDSIPGTDSPNTDLDQWIEIVNVSGTTLDLTGWYLYLDDSTDSAQELWLPGSSATFRFSDNGYPWSFAPNERMVIGNVAGNMDDDILIQIFDYSYTTIDQVTLGGDNLNDGLAPDGDTDSACDEAVARFPDLVDTDNDDADFVERKATIGTSNGSIAYGSIVINEVVTDPQQNWDDSGCSGGCGSPFDSIPGPPTSGEPPSNEITTNDEWIEFVNVSGEVMDINGLIISMDDSTASVEDFTTSSLGLYFSDGGSLCNFQPGEYLVVGNALGSINNDVFIELKDRHNTVIDDVEIGDDNEEDGIGDGAPDGSTDGNASDLDDESVFRFPDARDTDNDVNDFKKGNDNDTGPAPATIGRYNGGSDDAEVFVTPLIEAGDSLFVRITDDDANTNAGRIDSFYFYILTLRPAGESGDLEAYQALETEVNTGIFTVTLATTALVSPPPTHGNNDFEVSGGDVIKVWYQDQSRSKQALVTRQGNDDVAVLLVNAIGDGVASNEVDAIPIPCSTGSAPEGMEISPDGMTALTGNSGGLGLSELDIDGRSEDRLLYNPSSASKSVVMSNDQSLYVLGDEGAGEVVFINPHTGLTGNVISSHTWSGGCKPQGMDISPDGTLLAVSDYPCGTIHVYSLTDRTSLATPLEEVTLPVVTTQTTDVYFTPDGSTLFATSEQEEVLIAIDVEELDGSTSGYEVLDVFDFRSLVTNPVNSNDGPEGLVIGEMNGVTYAFVIVEESWSGTQPDPIPSELFVFDVSSFTDGENDNGTISLVERVVLSGGITHGARQLDYSEEDDLVLVSTEDAQLVYAFRASELLDGSASGNEEIQTIDLSTGVTPVDLNDIRFRGQGAFAFSHVAPTTNVPTEEVLISSANKPTEDTLTLNWDPTTDPNIAYYSVYGSNDPTTFNSYVDITNTDSDNNPTDRDWTGPGVYLYYLVVPRGSLGERGPVHSNDYGF